MSPLLLPRKSIRNKPHHIINHKSVFEKSQGSLQKAGQLPFLCLQHSPLLQPNTGGEETTALEGMSTVGTERWTGDKHIRKEDQGEARAGVLHKTTAENLLITISHLQRLNVQVKILFLIEKALPSTHEEAAAVPQWARTRGYKQLYSQHTFPPCVTQPGVHTPP